MRKSTFLLLLFATIDVINAHNIATKEDTTDRSLSAARRQHLASSYGVWKRQDVEDAPREYVY